MTATAISIDQFVTAGDTELFAVDIQTRLAYLEACGDALEKDDIAERDQLRAFRDEVARLTGGPFDRACIVPDDLLADHLREEAEENGTVPASIAPYVEWGILAQACRASGEFRPLGFGDDPVWVR